MSKRLITEEQALRDLRHLATEIVPLLRSRQTPAEQQVNHRLAAELADTAWKLLRDCGPVKVEGNGYTLGLRALTDGLVQSVGWDEEEGSTPVQSTHALRPDAWALWFNLELAVPCSEQLYADLLKLAEVAQQHTRLDAEQRWDAAEAALLAEGLLPVRVLAPPSAVGGARYVCEVHVRNDLVPALRETLAWWGGYILAHRPVMTSHGEVPGMRYYTLSLASVDDQWGIAALMVFQFYADQAEQKGGVAHG